nr:MAG TPA: hypothetical protein [Caudoviricetes sp.]
MLRVVCCLYISVCGYKLHVWGKCGTRVGMAWILGGGRG